MLPDPSTRIPLDPEEFVASLQYAGMVAGNELLEEIPGFTKSRIGMRDGTYGFRKEPFILFAFAARRYFRNEPDKFAAFMSRLFALKQLFHCDEMEPYRKGADDEQQFHHAVIEVAATEQLSEGCRFEPKSFFRKVGQVAERMETDGPTR